MSVTYEDVDPDFLALHRQGDVVGETEITKELALEVGFDPVAVFEGTEDELRKFAVRILDLLDAEKGTKTTIAVMRNGNT